MRRAGATRRACFAPAPSAHVLAQHPTTLLPPTSPPAGLCHLPTRTVPSSRALPPRTPRRQNRQRRRGQWVRRAPRPVRCAACLPTGLSCAARVSSRLAATLPRACARAPPCRALQHSRAPPMRAPLVRNAAATGAWLATAPATQQSTWRGPALTGLGRPAALALGAGGRSPPRRHRCHQTELEPRLTRFVKRRRVRCSCVAATGRRPRRASVLPPASAKVHAAPR